MKKTISIILIVLTSFSAFSQEDTIILKMRVASGSSGSGYDPGAPRTQQFLDSIEAVKALTTTGKLNISDTTAMLDPYKTSYPRQAIGVTGSILSYDPVTGILSGAGGQPLSANLTNIAALANGSGLLRNNGSGTFSYDNAAYITSSALSPYATLAMLGSYAPLASPSFTGTVTGITAAMVGAPTGSGTSSGSNTGDNSVNSLYSGLAAQKLNISDTAAMLANKLNLSGGTLTGLLVGTSIAVTDPLSTGWGILSMVSGSSNALEGTASAGIGVNATSTSGHGVYSTSTSGMGVLGSSQSNVGGNFQSNSGIGLQAYSTTGNHAEIGSAITRTTFKNNGRILVNTQTDNGVDNLQINGSAMLTGQLTIPAGTVSGSAVNLGQLNGKLNISDTAAMMAAAPRTQVLLDSIIAVKALIGSAAVDTVTSTGVATIYQNGKNIYKVEYPNDSMQISFHVDGRQDTLITRIKFNLTTIGTSGAASIDIPTNTINIPNYSASSGVTNFSAGTLSPLFTTSVATSTTTPALTFNASTASAYTFLGRASGTGAYSFISGLDSNWIPGLHTEAYYNTKYALIGSGGSGGDVYQANINNFTKINRFQSDNADSAAMVIRSSSSSVFNTLIRFRNFNGSDGMTMGVNEAGGYMEMSYGSGTLKWTGAGLVSDQNHYVNGQFWSNNSAIFQGYGAGANVVSIYGKPSHTGFLLDIQRDGLADGSDVAVHGTTGNVSINSTADNGAKLQVNGSISIGLRNVSATATVNATTDNTIICTANTFTVTLPSAVTYSKIPFTIVNKGTGVITIATAAGNISGSATFQLLTQYKYVTIVSDGTDYNVTANN